MPVPPPSQPYKLKLEEDYPGQERWRIALDHAELEYYESGTKLFKLTYALMLIYIVGGIILLMVSCLVPVLVGSVVSGIMDRIYQSFSDIPSFAH